MTGSTFSLTSKLSDVQVARLVSHARNSLDLTEDELADQLGRPLALLRAWECGEARPTDADITVLAALSGVSAEALVLRVESFVVERASGMLRVGESTAYVDASQGNEHVLRTYINLVRTMRMLADDEPVELRSHDLDVLADYLDLDDDALVDQLALVTQVTHAEARELRRRLVRRPILASVAGVLAGGMVGLGLGDRLVEQASRPSDSVTVETPATSAGPDLTTSPRLAVTTLGGSAVATVTRTTVATTTVITNAPGTTVADPAAATIADATATYSAASHSTASADPELDIAAVLSTEPVLGEAVAITNRAAPLPLPLAEP